MVNMENYTSDCSAMIDALLSSNQMPPQSKHHCDPRPKTSVALLMDHCYMAFRVNKTYEVIFTKNPQVAAETVKETDRCLNIQIKTHSEAFRPLVYVRGPLCPAPKDHRDIAIAST
jgi:hypothetical protein